MKIKFIIFLLVTVVFVSGCTTQSNDYTVYKSSNYEETYVCKTATESSCGLNLRNCIGGVEYKCLTNLVKMGTIPTSEIEGGNK